jgi:hypothetical protein
VGYLAKGETPRRLAACASFAASASIAALLGFAVDAARRTNLDMARLGMATTLLLVLITAKTALDCLRKPPPKTKERGCEPRPNLGESLKGELRTAPRELSARRERYDRTLVRSYKAAVKSETAKSCAYALKAFGIVVSVMFFCYLAYAGSVPIGVAAAFAFFFLTL